MKKIYLTFALFIGSLSVQAQSKAETGLENLFKLELGLHGLGLGYELPFSNKWSVDLSAGLGGGYSIGDSYASGLTGNFILSEPVAYFKSEFRYYYNRNKRLTKARPISNNAGNYIAWQTKYTTRRVFNNNAWDQLYDPLNRTLLNEVHWGIQRPLGQKFLFNFHLGFGYAHDFDFGNSSVYPALGLKFAYILNKSQ